MSMLTVKVIWIGEGIIANDIIYQGLIEYHQHNYVNVDSHSDMDKRRHYNKCKFF